MNMFFFLACNSVEIYREKVGGREPITPLNPKVFTTFYFDIISPRDSGDSGESESIEFSWFQ